LINSGNCHGRPLHQPFKGLKLATVSLGCSKNKVDTESVLGSLCALGISLTSDFNSADLIMVNTCSFIESAQEESIYTLLQLRAETEANRPIIFAAGCLVETIGTGIINRIPEIDGAIGAHSYQYLEQFVSMLLKNRRVALKKDAGNNYYESANRVLTAPAHSINIKIAEGCSNCCHYCLIPQIRGSYRSREPRDIVNEIAYFLNNGAREISLIAQDTTAYGSDRHDLPDLAGLLKEILKLDQRFWLRIMYAYPSRITEQLIDLIANEPRICNYLDLPIQHASSRVLCLMGRHYDRDELDQLISALRIKVPDLTLRTTCMVGYPGEGTREFYELISFIRKQKFEHLGAFTYSRQEKTTAAGLGSSCPIRVISKRHRQLMLEQQKISFVANLKRVGQSELILIDRPMDRNDRYYFGRTVKEAPEVDGGIIVSANSKLRSGDLIKAKILAAKPYTLMAVQMETLNDFPAEEVKKLK
jgi:ribosomal protein S12 methylthiotransferase